MLPARTQSLSAQTGKPWLQRSSGFLPQNRLILLYEILPSLWHGHRTTQETPFVTAEGQNQAKLNVTLRLVMGTT